VGAAGSARLDGIEEVRGFEPHRLHHLNPKNLPQKTANGYPHLLPARLFPFAIKHESFTLLAREKAAYGQLHSSHAINASRRQIFRSSACSSRRIIAHFLLKERHYLRPSGGDKRTPHQNFRLKPSGLVVEKISEETGLFFIRSAVRRVDRCGSLDGRAAMKRTAPPELAAPPITAKRQVVRLHSLRTTILPLYARERKRPHQPRPPTPNSRQPQAFGEHHLQYIPSRRSERQPHTDFLACAAPRCIAPARTVPPLQRLRAITAKHRQERLPPSAVGPTTTSRVGPSTFKSETGCPASMA